MKKILILICWLFIVHGLAAHPMPNTLIELRVLPAQLHFQIKIPLSDIQSVIFHAPDSIPEGPTTLPVFQQLNNYFGQHLRIAGSDGAYWPVSLTQLDTLKISDPLLGPYRELHLSLMAYPPQGVSPRQFILYYDAILHQIVTHQAILGIYQDWENGIHGDNTKSIAVIQVEPKSGEVLPVAVQIEKGTIWKGFTAMFRLGMQHIAEGYDHLLFLLLLLVVAPLLRGNSYYEWGVFGGWRYGLMRLLAIITAFTVGHSVTLAICSLGWLPFSSRIVEIAIAASIVVSAINVLIPLFSQKEAWVAGAFGLVHGMAFSNTLTELSLSSSQLGWSLLGFNLGIEMVQLGIVAVAAPVIFMISRSKYQRPLRWASGTIGIIAGLYWITTQC